MFVRCRKKTNSTYKNSYNKSEEALSTGAVLKTLNTYLDEESRNNFISIQKLTNKQFKKIQKTTAQLQQQLFRENKNKIGRLEYKKSELVTSANYLFLKHIDRFHYFPSPSVHFEREIHRELERGLGYIRRDHRDPLGAIPLSMLLTGGMGAIVDTFTYCGVKKICCVTLIIPILCGSYLYCEYRCKRPELEKALTLNTNALAMDLEIQTIKSKMAVPTMQRD